MSIKIILCLMSLLSGQVLGDTPVAPQAIRALESPSILGIGARLPAASQLPALVRVAASPTAHEIAGRVQKFYKTTTVFRARFSQTVTNQTFNKLKPVVSSGNVYILKPGKMRWDYKVKSRATKSFISDGKHLWAVMHKSKQYYKSSLSNSALPVAVSFLMGTGDLRKEFEVTFDRVGKYGSKQDILLLLTPKKPSARYKKLWLVVDSASFAVKQSVVLNSKGDTNSIRFDSVSTADNGKIKPGHFVFNAQANKSYRPIKPPKSNGPVAP